jgi:toxin YoeB
MLYTFSKKFFSDIKALKKEDSKLAAKIWELIADISENANNPLNGIGKPERLKGNMSGYYSRRITDKHRLIYSLTNDTINLVSCYGHYDDN